jgi:hypothetical protein
VLDGVRAKAKADLQIIVAIDGGGRQVGTVAPLLLWTGAFAVRQHLVLLRALHSFSFSSTSSSARQATGHSRIGEEDDTGTSGDAA